MYRHLYLISTSAWACHRDQAKKSSAKMIFNDFFWALTQLVPNGGLLQLKSEERGFLISLLGTNISPCKPPLLSRRFSFSKFLWDTWSFPRRVEPLGTFGGKNFPLVIFFFKMMNVFANRKKSPPVLEFRGFNASTRCWINGWKKPCGSWKLDTLRSKLGGGDFFLSSQSPRV